VAEHSKLDDAVWRRLVAKIGEAKNAYVKVGVLASAGGDKEVSKGLTLLELAAIHEFGSPAANIPERSFIRRTFSESEGRETLNKMLERIARGILADNLTAAQGLETLGLWAANAIKMRIKSKIPPPLQPATIKEKLKKGHAGGSTPLVATGQLIDSITSEVRT
jgi:hypothetical protein